MTLAHCSAVQWRCSLAQANRFALCTVLSRSFLAAILPFRPIVWSLFLMVLGWRWTLHSSAILFRSTDVRALFFRLILFRWRSSLGVVFLLAPVLGRSLTDPVSLNFYNTLDTVHITTPTFLAILAIDTPCRCITTIHNLCYLVQFLLLTMASRLLVSGRRRVSCNQVITLCTKTF